MKKIKRGKVGSWYETEIREQEKQVHKKLKQSVYENYNKRLEKFLLWQKKEIEQEFKKKYKRTPEYRVTITRDGRLLLKTNLNKKEEEYLKQILHRIIDKAREQIPEVNRVIYENVKQAIPENVPARQRAEKMTEVYEYGGRTLYTLHKEVPLTEVQKDYSKIINLSFRAFKKGVILDAHTGNWTKSKDGKIMYIDFEPHSVTLSRGLFRKNVPQEKLALKKFADSLQEMLYFAFMERSEKEGERVLHHILKEIKENAYSELSPEQAEELLTDMQIFAKRIKARKHALRRS